MVDPSRFPSLASIRAFEAAARHTSFARAACELGTTAASVSYHVRQLETQLGVQLFLRWPHRVVLTKPGSIVASEAMNAFAALRQSFVKAVDADDALIRVTTLPTFGTSWLTPKLGQFRALHPEVTVELDLSTAPQDLAIDGFDIAIRHGQGKWPGLKSIRLFPSIFVPLCLPSLKHQAKGSYRSYSSVLHLAPLSFCFSSPLPRPGLCLRGVVRCRRSKRTELILW